MTSRKKHQLPPDEVTRYLERRGVSDAVVRLGLAGMIDAWTRIAMSAERYDLTLDDWINDLDMRDIIAGALAAAPTSQRDDLTRSLAHADDLFRAATLEAAEPLSTSLDPDADEANSERRWWYRRYPSTAGETLRSDLTSEGLL